jgi:hypothetical protein
MELVDIGDLKSPGSNAVRVRLPPWAPELNSICRGGVMVAALVLGTSPARGGGSSPLPGTKETNQN